MRQDSYELLLGVSQTALVRRGIFTRQKFLISIPDFSYHLGKQSKHSQNPFILNAERVGVDGAMCAEE